MAGEQEGLSSAQWGRDGHSYIQTGETGGSQVKGKLQSIRGGRESPQSFFPFPWEKHSQSMDGELRHCGMKGQGSYRDFGTDGATRRVLQKSV